MYPNDEIHRRSQEKREQRLSQYQGGHSSESWMNRHDDRRDEGNAGAEESPRNEVDEDQRPHFEEALGGRHRKNTLSGQGIHAGEEQWVKRRSPSGRRSVQRDPISVEKIQGDQIIAAAVANKQRVSEQDPEGDAADEGHDSGTDKEPRGAAPRRAPAGQSLRD